MPSSVILKPLESQLHRVGMSKVLQVSDKAQWQPNSSLRSLNANSSTRKYERFYEIPQNTSVGGIFDVRAFCSKILKCLKFEHIYFRFSSRFKVTRLFFLKMTHFSHDRKPWKAHFSYLIQKMRTWGISRFPGYALTCKNHPSDAFWAFQGTSRIFKL